MRRVCGVEAEAVPAGLARAAVVGDIDGAGSQDLTGGGMKRSRRYRRVTRRIGLD